MSVLPVGKIQLVKLSGLLQQVCRYLPLRPIILLDSEYGNASFLNQTGDIEADFLLRIRSNRCLYAAPPEYTGKGRPRKHGEKFKLNDPSTWWEAAESIEVEDAKLERLRVRIWKDLHFSGSASTPMQLLLVERLEVESEKPKSKPLWLVWSGQSILSLSEIWRKYLRRFAVDHWYRFIKQRLHWTVPQFSTPQQCERWSDLMPIMTWELWLARDLVSQYHLLWQKPPKEFDSLVGSLSRLHYFCRRLAHRLLLPNPVESLLVGLRETNVLKELVIP